MSEKELCNSLKRFACDMQAELNVNVQKGGEDDWKTCNVLWLLAKLMEETGEVADAILDRNYCGTVREECADVANIALMIADAYEYQGKQGGDEHETNSHS